MKYEKPKLDVIALETEDIVCASGLTDGGKDDNDGKWS